MILCNLVACSYTAETPECRSMGFTGFQLCSDCDTMANYVKDKGLVADCHQCCVRGKEGGDTKFSAAVLEADLNQIRAFPHIDGFVKHKAHRYLPRLRIRDHYMAVMPRLVLTPEGGGAKQTVNIEGWKTENVEEFLDEKLFQPTSTDTTLSSAS